MNLPEVVAILKGSYRPYKFRAGDHFYWSPESKEIYYDRKAEAPSGVWSLLHETGHALLGHTAYKADYELIKLEVAAWEKAKDLASDMAIQIDEDHIQDCIDTYRDWLYGRSICPTCGTKSIQQADLALYQCFNCHANWKVTPSRFCRAYRSLNHTKKPSAVFRLTDGSL